MPHHFCCPQCGNQDLQIATISQTTTQGSNYSVGQGCLGYLLFGPLGLLCGACGHGKTTSTTQQHQWACPKCGHIFEHPDEMRKRLNFLPKATFKVMCIIGAVIAFCVFLIFAKDSFGFSFLLASCILGVFCLVGYLSEKFTASTRENLEQKIEEIETSMNRFYTEDAAVQPKNNTVPESNVTSASQLLEPRTDCATPLQAMQREPGKIVCPLCGTEQNSNRYCCFHCGVSFTPSTPAPPYQCGNCGNPGPYDGKCPSCGSSLKKFNTP